MAIDALFGYLVGGGKRARWHVQAKRRKATPLSGTIELLGSRNRDGIALSSPGKLDDRFGYNCHCGIIAIDQTQLTNCIFKRRCEHRDSVRPKDFLFSLGGVRNGHFTVRA